MKASTCIFVYIVCALSVCVLSSLAASTFELSQNSNYGPR